MKKFMKFIAMIIVVTVLLFAVKFLMDQNKTYVLTHLDTVDVNEPNYIEPLLDPILNPEKNPTTTENAPRSVEDIVEDIRSIEKMNYEAEAVMTNDENMGVEKLGEAYRSYFETFGMDSTTVRVQIAGKMVHLMPYSDFIDEQEFHYNDEGELVLFKNIGAGSGFVTKLYFDKGSLILTEEVDEGEILNESGDNYESKQFDVNEILSRGAIFYGTYFNEYANN